MADYFKMEIQFDGKSEDIKKLSWHLDQVWFKDETGDVGTPSMLYGAIESSDMDTFKEHGWMILKGESKYNGMEIWLNSIREWIDNNDLEIEAYGFLLVPESF